MVTWLIRPKILSLKSFYIYNDIIFNFTIWSLKRVSNNFCVKGCRQDIHMKRRRVIHSILVINFWNWDLDVCVMCFLSSIFCKLFHEMIDWYVIEFIPYSVVLFLRNLHLFVCCSSGAMFMWCFYRNKIIFKSGWYIRIKKVKNKHTVEKWVELVL